MTVYEVLIDRAEFHGVQVSAPIEQYVSQISHRGDDRSFGLVPFIDDGKWDPGYDLQGRMSHDLTVKAAGKHLVLLAKDKWTMVKALARYHDHNIVAPGNNGPFYTVVKGFYARSITGAIGKTLAKGRHTVTKVHRPFDMMSTRDRIEKMKMRDRGYYVVLATNTDFSQNNNILFVRQITPNVHSISLGDLAKKIAL